MENPQNSFLTTLTEIRSGKCLNDLSEKLAELIGAVREVGKAGALQLRIDIKPLPGDACRVFVTDKVSLKLPETVKPMTIFYPTEDNRLARKDPNQPELPLRAVRDADDDPETLPHISAEEDAATRRAATK